MTVGWDGEQAAYRHSPLLGMSRQQGREMGEMECWETKADRLPVGNKVRTILMCPHGLQLSP